jgi:hypothetical protein
VKSYGTKSGVRALWLTCAALCLHAQTTVVLKDSSGKELRRVPAYVEPAGGVILSRSALAGAVSAVVAGTDRESRLVTGEDPEFDLVRLWFGPGPLARDFAPLPESGILHTANHETRIEKPFDSPNFGLLYRLHTDKRHPRDGQILFDSAGRPVAWYSTRLVDGQLFTFAIPPEKLAALRPVLLGIQEWNSLRNPNFDEPYQRAIGYMWVEDYEGAAYYLRAALKADPNNARAWFHLAFAEGKRGQGAERIACYRKALALDPDIAEAHYNLALAMIMKGDNAAAEASLAELYRLQSPLAPKLAGFMGIIHVDTHPGKDENVHR